MDPARIALNRMQGETERCLVETVNDHHCVVATTKTMSGFVVEPRQVVMRCIWKEAHPRTYVFIQKSCEHSSRPIATSNVVRAFFTSACIITPLSDGASSCEYTMTCDARGSMPYIVSKSVTKK